MVVIGAGFGGLGAAVALRRGGITEVTVLERADDVGGVWRENTYPGAACDVPSALYSWSWAPNPDWPRRYSPQADILGYIERVARETGIRDSVITGTSVTALRYDDATHVWTVTAEGPDGVRTYEAELVVSAVGQLSAPVVPSLPGREAFAGPAFHSAEWRHDVDLRGRRVAVVGTGASAIQFVPGIADDAAHITVFQRSAPYVIPKPDGPRVRVQRAALRRIPGLQRLERRAVFWLTEQMNRALTEETWLKGLIHRWWRMHLRRTIADPALRDALQPDYELGCKRVLFSNTWYRTLARDHVDVVTDDVAALEADGVRTRDGVLHEADVVIWGTGFAATDFLRGIDVTGRDGARLADVWADGAFAHLGVSVPGFPGLAVVYGPNTNLGGSSIIGMMEAQSAYVVQLAQAMTQGRIVSPEVRADVAAAYDREMQERLGTSVWARCDSWYRTASGRVSTNWPGMVAEYQRRLSQLDLGDFVDAAAS